MDNHYRVFVSYAKLPGVAALEEKFSGKVSVSRLFDGRVWERHNSCSTIDDTPGEREFQVAEVPEEFQHMSIDCMRDDSAWVGLAAYFAKKCFRFAIETEAVEFAAANPDLQREKGILVLGSSALSDVDHRFVASLWAREDRRRVLGNVTITGALQNYRLLLVHN